VAALLEQGLATASQATRPPLKWGWDRAVNRIDGS
jgi:hypothetical protein